MGDDGTTGRGAAGLWAGAPNPAAPLPVVPLSTQFENDPHRRRYAREKKVRRPTTRRRFSGDGALTVCAVHAEHPTPPPSLCQGAMPLVLWTLLPLALRLTPDLSQRDHGVHIAKSPGKGMGAFASCRFAARETVGDYTGEMVSLERHEARYGGSREGWTAEDAEWLASREARDVSVTGEYVVRITDDLFVDAEDPDASSWCRFINHDAKPNLALKVLPKGIAGKPRVWFVALRNIEVKDELCFDYGPDFWVEELDGVATAHNERIESTLPPSPWYNQPGSGAGAAVDEPVVAAVAPSTSRADDEFAAMEAALLENLVSWQASCSSDE